MRMSGNANQSRKVGRIMRIFIQFGIKSRKFSINHGMNTRPKNTKPDVERKVKKPFAFGRKPARKLQIRAITTGIAKRANCCLTIADVYRSSSHSLNLIFGLFFASFLQGLAPPLRILPNKKSIPKASGQAYEDHKRIGIIKATKRVIVNRIMASRSP